eukprot:1082376-Prorocentrum_minimum.AAC.2
MAEAWNIPNRSRPLAEAWNIPNRSRPLAEAWNIPRTCRLSRDAWGRFTLGVPPFASALDALKIPSKGRLTSPRARGDSVDVKGNRADVKGNSVDVKGNSVDVKGNSVDVEDKEKHATQHRTELGSRTGERSGVTPGNTAVSAPVATHWPRSGIFREYSRPRPMVLLATGVPTFRCAHHSWLGLATRHSMAPVKNRRANRWLRSGIFREYSRPQPMVLLSRERRWLDRMLMVRFTFYSVLVDPFSWQLRGHRGTSLASLLDIGPPYWPRPGIFPKYSGSQPMGHLWGGHGTRLASSLSLPRSGPLAKLIRRL